MSQVSNSLTEKTEKVETYQPVQSNPLNLNITQPIQTTNPIPEKKGFSFIKKTNPQSNTSINNPQQSTSNSNLNQQNNNILNIPNNTVLNLPLQTNDNDIYNIIKYDEERKSDSNFSNALNKLDMYPNTTSQSIKENSVAEENYNQVIPETDNNSNSHNKNVENEPQNQSSQNSLNTDSKKKSSFAFIKKKQPAETTKEAIYENPNYDVSDTKSQKSFKHLKDNLYSENIGYMNQKEDQKGFKNNHSDNNIKISIAEKIPINIKETAETIRANIKESKKKNEDFLKEILIKIHLIKTVIYNKEDILKSKNQELETVLNNQVIATENNDFDEAQELENYATKIKDVIKDLKRILSENEREMVLLREQEILCIKQRIKVYEDSQNILQNLKQSQESELDHFVNTNISKHKNDKIKIKKMNEKLEILKSNLETKKSHIDEEEEKVNNLIKSQSSHVFVEKEEFEGSRNGNYK